MPVDIARLLGIHISTLRYWHRTEFFSPSVRRHALRYNFLDLCVLACIVTMQSKNVSVQRMRKEQLPVLKELLAKALNDGLELRDLCFTLLTKKRPLLYIKGGLYSKWQPEFNLSFGELWDSMNDLKISVTRDADTQEV